MEHEMTASLETLVVAAYVFACGLRIPRPGPPGAVTDQELIALAVAQAITGLSSDRQFLGAMGKLLPGFSPRLPTQTRYNRRLRRLTPWIATVQLMVAELVAEAGVRLADGTLIGCANYPGCTSKSELAGHAAYGYCPSKSEFVWGMRLVLIADIKGVPVGYDLVGPKTGQERETAWELAQAQPGSLLFCDGGFWGAEYNETMELIDVRLMTPDKHRLSKPPEAEKAKARIRLGCRPERADHRRLEIEPRQRAQEGVRHDHVDLQLRVAVDHAADLPEPAPAREHRIEARDLGGDPDRGVVVGAGGRIVGQERLGRAAD